MTTKKKKTQERAVRKIEKAVKRGVKKGLTQKKVEETVLMVMDTEKKKGEKRAAKRQAH